MRYTSLLPAFALTQVFLAAKECHGFNLQQSSIRHRDSSLRLQQDSSPRRDFLDVVKRVFIGTAGMMFSQGCVGSVAFADELGTAGKIVEFQVANLDGEPGKSGKIRIQLKPEWAPRGVSRFEVS